MPQVHYFINFSIMQMCKFWALFNTAIAAALSAGFALFFLVNSERREATFGKTTSEWYGSYKLEAVGSLLAAFALTLLAALIGLIALCLVASSKEKLVCVALALNVLALGLSGAAFVYFMEVTVTVNGVSLPTGVSPEMEWGPGLNIGATINFFIGIVQCAVYKRSLGKAQAANVRMQNAIPGKPVPEVSGVEVQGAGGSSNV